MNPVEGLDPTEGDLNQSPRRSAWRAAIDHQATNHLLDEDARLFLHQSLSTPCLDVLASCEGSHLTNLRGTDLLDFHGNSVHQVGHANRRVIEAIKQQIDSLAFCPRRFTNQPAIELADQLVRITPGELGKVLFAPGGTAAMGMALKLARLATGRFKTISWWDSFHGASLDAISIGGEALFRQGLGPLLPGAMHVPPPGARLRDGRCVSAMESADYAEYVMDHETDVAAFVAEPIRCTIVTMPPAAYWQRMRALCDRHGALLIFDEIPIGLGRTGRMFACEHAGVVPDILCLGKGLGGGIMPLAAMVAHPSLDIAPRVALGHYTHEKSPVACAAGLAALAYIEEERLVARAEAMGAYLEGGLTSLRSRHPAVGEIRRAGLLLGVDVVVPGSPGTADPDRAEQVLYAALGRGLSFKVSDGNVLTLAPPLTISHEEVDTAVAILDAALTEATGMAP